jgi:tetratricopeptide (TPR) repeat protein
VLTVWAAVAWRRLGDWKDARSLYAASLRADARNPYSLYALGELDVIEGRYETGDARLRQAIALGDRPWRAHTALCFSLLRQSRLDEARAECESSLAIHAGNPRTWVNLASIYVRQTLWAPALASAREALVYRAGYAEAHYLAGVALANLGHMPEAAAELAQTLAIDPGHAGAGGVVQLLRSRGVLVP